MNAFIFVVVLNVAPVGKTASLPETFVPSTTLSPPPLLSVWDAKENPLQVQVPVVPSSADVVPAAKKATGPSVAPVGGVKTKLPPQVNSPSEFNLLGVSLDAGVPDFAGINMSVRPFRSHWLRLEAGAFSPGVGAGMRGGLTLVPFHWAVRLTFTGEAGRYFKNDANNIVRLFGGTVDNPAVSSAISSVSYDFANAHAGLEFGNKNFGFFLRGGLSYVDFTFDKAIAAIPSGDTGTFSGDPVHVRATLPTLKLGINFFFL